MGKGERRVRPKKIWYCIPAGAHQAERWVMIPCHAPDLLANNSENSGRRHQRSRGRLFRLLGCAVRRIRPRRIGRAVQSLPGEEPGLRWRVCNCMPIFGGLVLGCIEADPCKKEDAFCSSFQALQYLHTCAPFQSQYLTFFILFFHLDFTTRRARNEI